MMFREVTVTSLPSRCPYCGSNLVSDNVDDFWKVCQQCEIVFIEPVVYEVA